MSKTISVPTIKVPEFLRNSTKFIENEDKDMIEVHRDVYQKSWFDTGLSEEDQFSIKSLEDFERQVVCLLDWHNNEVPYALYDFIRENIEPVDEEDYESPKINFDNFLANHIGKHQNEDDIEFIAKLEIVIKNRNFMYKAVAENYFDLLNYGIKRKFPLTTHLMQTASWEGRLKMMQFLFSQKIPILKDAVVNSAWRGNLDCLKFAVENGGPITDGAFSHAVRCGFIEIVEYLFEHAKPSWKLKSNITSLVPGIHDNIELLKLLHEKYEMPLDEETFQSAISSGCYQCAVYCRDKKCPINPWAHYYATLNLNKYKAIVENKKKKYKPKKIEWFIKQQKIYEDCMAILIEVGCPSHEVLPEFKKRVTVN